MEKYLVVQEHNINSLMEVVNRFIQEGYKPQGGVSIQIGYQGVSSNILYTQALIKQ